MKPQQGSSEWPLREDKTSDTDDLRTTSHVHAAGPRSTMPEVQAHADGEEQQTWAHGAAFPHEKLKAYQLAVEMAKLAKKLAAEIPRGYRNVADHLLRAASNTVLLMAEGANRRGVGEKRQRFAESRGECGEVGAAGDLLLAYDIGSRPDAEALKRLASRVSAMLTRLMARLDEMRP